MNFGDVAAFGAGMILGYFIGSSIEEMIARRREKELEDQLNFLLGKMASEKQESMPEAAAAQAPGAHGIAIDECAIGIFQGDAKRAIDNGRRAFEQGDGDEVRLNVGRAFALADLAKAAAVHLGLSDLSASASEIANDAKVLLNRLERDMP
jgi:hypothetical protein